MDKHSVTTYEGTLVANDLRFGIVCSRFNDIFVTRLLDGAIGCITRHGGSRDKITIVWVPGSFEIPLATDQLATSGKYDAVIALGVVIQGATQHAHYINSHVSSTLGEIGLRTRIPVIYGVVTTENTEQALERSGSKEGNRGAAAAVAAIEMANLMKALKH